MEEENAEDWESSFFKAIENVNRQNQYIERGKLGGRPKSDAPKTERLALRFTPSEMKILQNRADEKKLKLTDYSRIILLEKQLPDYEKNDLLMEYGTNFRRIANYMKKDMFSEKERADLL
ncbi:plasmid mobilization protein, partial [Candidatus Chryseobacterium massiliense]